MNLKDKFVIILGILILFGVGFGKVNDYQDYNPTVIVEANKFQKQENKELLKGVIISDDFKAKNNNLGIISVFFGTHDRVNEGYLQFSVREIGQTGWYYSNKYKVDQFSNLQYFPFGFPEIKNSAGKDYQFQLESIDGIEGNSIEIVVKNKPFLNKYSFPKAYLMQNKDEIPIFILSKVKSFFNHLNLDEYLLVLGIFLLLPLLLRLVNTNKLWKRIKKLERISTKVKKKFFIELGKNKLLGIFLIVFCVFGLFVINNLINSPISIKALSFSDDLINWTIFDTKKGNFFTYIFTTWGNKFRPVFYVVFYSLFYLFGSNTWLFGVFNLLFKFLIATLLFFLFRKISRNTFISFGLSVVYIVSRFAYFDMAQALGVMEAMALLFSVLLLYLLWLFLNTEKLKYFWTSAGVFLLLLFIHERFVTLLLPFFVIFFLLKNTSKKILLFVISTLPVVFLFAVKIFVLRINALDGTGGTNIVQTFNIASFFQFFISGCFYLFGVNAGPMYLSGISNDAVPQNINNLIMIGNICLLLIFFIFACLVLKGKKILYRNYLNNFVLFFVFILSTLIAASVTIRLEMRWLYVPFVGLLFLLAYMFGVILKQKTVNFICFLVFLLWIGMYIPREIFYRSYFKNIYFWPGQIFGNSLYEATVKKYGDNFWNYETYILCAEKSSPLMLSCADHGDLSLFFTQYRGNEVKTEIHLVKSMSEVEEKDSKKIILIYNQQQSKFIELKIGNNLREAVLGKGWYGWNGGNASIWTGKKAEVWFMTGGKGKMTFLGYMPEFNMPNGVNIYIDDKLIKEFGVKSSIIKFEAITPKNKIIDLKINVDHSMSPAAVGAGPDVRELGVLVNDITFE